MNGRSQRKGRSALIAALKAALQWRLLALWLLGTLLATLPTVLPAWGWLQETFGHSPHAPDIAAGRDLALLAEGLLGLRDQTAWLGSGVILGLAATMLLSPWLTGMAMASLRADGPLDFPTLLRDGLREYGRMFRMLLWSVVPLGLALAVGGGARAFADDHTAQTILVSEAEAATRIALVAFAIAAVLAHAGIETGRGWLAAHADERSVLRAWWRGCRLLVRRPLATLAAYLGTSAAGGALALLFGLLRLQVDSSGWFGFAAAFALTQCAVAALAWGRIARLYALADLVAATTRDVMPPRSVPHAVERQVTLHSEPEAT